jgi:hypothetical protein
MNGHHAKSDLELVIAFSPFATHAKHPLHARFTPDRKSTNTVHDL